MKYGQFISLAMTIIYFSMSWFGVSHAEEKGIVEIHHIDVGYGDAVLIKSPTGESLLYDAGGRGKGYTEVLSYLIRQGIDGANDALDYMVISHYEPEQYGGIQEVIFGLDREPGDMHYNDDLRPEIAIYDRGWSGCGIDYENYLRAAGDMRQTLQPGEIFSMGPVTVECVAVNGIIDGVDYRPGDKISEECGGPAGYRENDFSIALLVEYGEFRYLVTGDLPMEFEAALGDYLETVDVYRAGERGGSSCSSQHFIGEINPSLSVISSGRNAFGNPQTEILSRLGQQGELYQTHVDGDVIIKSNSVDFWKEDIPEPEGKVNVYFDHDVDHEYIMYGGIPATWEVNIQEKFLERIEEADESILICMTHLNRSDATPICQALADKANAMGGIDIRVMIDYSMDNENNFNLNMLRDAGIPVQNNGENEYDYSMHIKGASFDAGGSSTEDDRLWIASLHRFRTTYYHKMAAIYLDIGNAELAAAFVEEFEVMWDDDGPDGHEDEPCCLTCKKFEYPSRIDFIVDDKPWTFIPAARRILDEDFNRHRTSMWETVKLADMTYPRFGSFDGGFGYYSDYTCHANHEFLIMTMQLSFLSKSTCYFHYFSPFDLYEALERRRLQSGIDIKGKLYKSSYEYPPHWPAWPEVVHQGDISTHEHYGIFDGLHYDSAPAVAFGSRRWTRLSEEHHDEVSLISWDPMIVNQFVQEFAARYAENYGVLENPKPVIDSIIPGYAFPEETTPVMIYGSNFDVNDRLAVKIGERFCGVNLETSRSWAIDAVIPEGLEPGDYTVEVVNSSGWHAEYAIQILENGAQTPTAPPTPEQTTTPTPTQVPPPTDTPLPTFTPASVIVINEIYFDDPGVDDHSFVELYGPPGASLNGYTITPANQDGCEICNIRLDGYSIPQDGFFVASMSGLINADLINDTCLPLLPNGPCDSVWLLYNDVIVDAVQYGPPEECSHFYGEGQPAAEPIGYNSISRIADGWDTDNNYDDFCESELTAGLPNLCVPTPSPVPTPAYNIVVNEIEYDDEGTDDRNYIELYGPPGAELQNYSVQILNQDCTILTAIVLNGHVIPNDGFFVIGMPALGDVVDLVDSENLEKLQNGPCDAVRLVYGEEEIIIDSVQYEPDFCEEMCGEGYPAPEASDIYSIGRFIDGYDTNGNSYDFCVCYTSPGSANSCIPEWTPPTFTPTNTPGETPPATPTETVPTVTPSPTVPLFCFHHGDVDSNRIITAGDAQTAYRIAMEIHYPTYYEECAADCNGDMAITTSDAQSIFNSGLGTDQCTDNISQENILPDALLNSPYYAQLPLPNDTEPEEIYYRFISGVLPPGLQFKSWGIIKGAPVSLGAFSFTIAAYDISGPLEEWIFSIGVKNTHNELASIMGIVVDRKTELPVENAEVTVFGYDEIETSDENGIYSLDVPTGEILIQIKKEGYVPINLKIQTFPEEQNAHYQNIPRAELQPLNEPIHVGPEGGIFTFEDNSDRTYELRIPSGALDSETDISITPLNLMPSVSDRMITNPVHIYPPNLQFNEPVQLKAPLGINMDCNTEIALSEFHQDFIGWRRSIKKAVVDENGEDAIIEFTEFPFFNELSKDKAKEMLSTTLGLDFGDNVSWNEQNEQPDAQICDASVGGYIINISSVNENEQQGSPMISNIDNCQGAAPVVDTWQECKKDTVHWEVGGSVSGEAGWTIAGLVQAKVGFEISGSYGQDSEHEVCSSSQHTIPPGYTSKIIKRWDVLTKTVEGEVYQRQCYWGVIRTVLIDDFSIVTKQHNNYYKAIDTKCTPTPSPSPTFTPSPTMTSTPTATLTPTSTISPTPTKTQSITPSPSLTPVTPLPTIEPEPSITIY